MKQQHLKVNQPNKNNVKTLQYSVVCNNKKKMK